MISFLIYFTTTELLPHYFVILAILLIIWQNYKRIFTGKINSILNVNLLIIFTIVLVGFINRIILYNSNSEIYQLFPYTTLMFLSYFIAKYLTKKDIKFLVILIAFEAIVGFFEYVLKINSVFYWKDFYIEYLNSDLLYSRKVFGLSSNSSGLAIKIMLGLLLIEYFKLFSTKIGILIRLLLAVGLVLSFQRTAIISVGLFYFMLILIFYYKKIKVIKWQIPQKEIVKRFFQITFVIIGIVVFVFFSNKIYYQFSRGKDKVSLSGREEIWPIYLQYIKDNPIYGNYSDKLYIKYHNKTITAHAHNSFLQVAASNGVIIFMLYLLLLIVNIRRRNAIYISSLIVLSLFQYALFWGISLVDIVFFVFVLKLPSNTENIKIERCNN